MRYFRFTGCAIIALSLFGPLATTVGESQAKREVVPLPSSKMLLEPVSGQAQPTNSFPSAVALSPDGRHLVILNNGYGTEGSNYEQSISILNLETNQLEDFPDARLAKRAHQTYFLGLSFSADAQDLYASIASLTDPKGEVQGDLGNGIAIYRFHDGKLEPGGFLKIPLAPLAPRQYALKVLSGLPEGSAVPYPAGLQVIADPDGEKLLIAENLADDAILLDAKSGEVLRRFPLSLTSDVPAAYPYAVVATRDGKTGYCSLWNASQVAQLDLESGKVVRRIPLLAPASPTAAGSHPTALLLSPDEKLLYVALSNVDRVAIVSTDTGQLMALLSTALPGQQYGGSTPNALALSSDGRRLYVADASANAIAVFDTSASGRGDTSSPMTPLGFIPTEWYPTALAVRGNDLFVVTGKGRGTGPNSRSLTGFLPSRPYPYIATLLHGSIARVNLPDAEQHLAELTREVEDCNLMNAAPQEIRFNGGRNPIHHVIYIIKENRTYDQILGDLRPGNGDSSLCLYCEEVTPNEHRLARQFGILDNFYDSGEVSGDGHVWSTAAITSDYNEKTWQISYRGGQRLYDYEGTVAHSVPLEERIPDVDEPGTGYIWANVARHGLTHRNYGEFVETVWCRPAGPPGARESSSACPRTVVRQGEALPPNVGQPHGSPSPWPWPVPMIARNVATKPELRDHFDPRFANFRLDYPDQLRVDEFLNEFDGFVRARQEGQGEELPQFVLLRLPNDHTAGTEAGMPRPAASVADNDVAVGRVVEAVSHSPYWDDTAIFILEDDAQDGADHVDAHRSIAFVISKYSPGSSSHPFVDHHFYTTVSVVRTIEVLLGLPPMNNNDAKAPVMALLFSGPGDQPPYTADARNRETGLIYQRNPLNAPGANQSAKMDFSRADAADAAALNAILWRDRKGDAPMPKTRHRVASH